eukprot:1136641-Pelagomonas_calceolata.AAC.7
MEISGLGARQGNIEKAGQDVVKHDQRSKDGPAKAVAIAQGWSKLNEGDGHELHCRTDVLGYLVLMAAGACKRPAYTFQPVYPYVPLVCCGIRACGLPQNVAKQQCDLKHPLLLCVSMLHPVYET